MKKIAAIFGSPRREGNSSTLLRQAIAGARNAGAEVKEVVLCDLTISPCLEIYGCKTTGKCVIKDDYEKIEALLQQVDGLILASPIFFYAVSAHTKILMDRCNSIWVKKYWIEKKGFGENNYTKKGLFISVGATKGKRLFEGARISVKYFMDALDMELWDTLFFGGLESEGDILQFPFLLEKANEAGKALVQALSE